MIKKKEFSCIGYRLWSMVYRLFCISRRLWSVVCGLSLIHGPLFPKNCIAMDYGLSTIDSSAFRAVSCRLRSVVRGLTILLTSSFILLTSPTKAQLLTPLSHEMNRRVEYEMLKSGTPFFTVLKPYIDTQLRGPARQDSLNFFPSSHFQIDSSSNFQIKQNWLRRKLFHESLIQIDSGDYYLFFDPAFDLMLGQDNTGKKIYSNTRGFTAGGRLGKNFAFGTSFYENQAIFPSWVHKGITNKIITGQGFGRVNGQTWDYAHASGYLSFSPVKKLNIQLGQGKNFIGDGYRSLLLSDVAYNYPYGRITFMNKKWMYSWMLGIIQDLSIPKGNDQYTYAKRLISSHLLSVNVTPRIQLSVIKNTVYNNPDTIGRFSPGLAEFNPVMLPVSSSNSHSLWGVNVKIRVTDRLWGYGQVAIDNLVGDEDIKTAFQAGAKYFDAFGLKGLYLQAEFNQAGAYTYTSTNKTLLWMHYREPLAHPAGSNFREALCNLVYSWRRWQFSSITGFIQPLESVSGPQPKTYGFPVMGNNREILHSNTQLNWFLNPKTTAHFSLGYVIHRESISGAATNNSLVYFAFRTALFNNYLYY